MLDYYGSMNMSREDIKIDIVLTSNFKLYSREYLYDIINYLYTRKMLNTSYSYAGWPMFHKQKAVEHIDNYIKLDTLNCKKKVALMLQLTNNKNIVYEPELFKKICDNLKIRLIY